MVPPSGALRKNPATGSGEVLFTAVNCVPAVGLKPRLTLRSSPAALRPLVFGPVSEGLLKLAATEVWPSPVNEISNGFLAGSLLATWIAAVKAPSTLGMKVILKVVLAPGTTVMLIPDVLTVKLLLFNPSLVMLIPVRFAVPKLRIW